ncbi:MAG: lytic transglycosylase domain-containing protein [Alphaproteobacteria bacterium]|nr:lytic transglycosylase domain-containing protein [Alphaproteobacteria bacterium]MDP7221651.1 lytic transglycosylase domain-containing protein [Alphaproteobacteria bacterium]
MMAAQNYDVPPEVMFGIYEVEGGRVGQVVGNTNGSYDIGPMQINTLWVPELARMWNVSEYEAFELLRDDPCVNTGVSAWILRSHLDETGDLAKAVGYYHSRTPHLTEAYKKRVMDAMLRVNLLR